MRFVIVSGMSGAGKSTALKMLEDAGYFCVDNLPIRLIKPFAKMAYDGETELDKIAVGIDIRSGSDFAKLEDLLQQMLEKEYQYEVLYLDASDEVLVRRYKETRRRHPLALDSRVENGILLERQKTDFLKKKAHYILDTSTMLTRELKAELDKIFVEAQQYNNLFITFVSFGFEYGIPSDSDLVFDVRFLPNPYYDLQLRQLTGNDEPIKEFVMKYKESAEFLDKLVDMMEFLVPQYQKEGKYQLVIGIGCTGGKHRSVTLANALYEALKEREYSAKVEHRDIDKDTKKGK